MKSTWFGDRRRYEFGKLLEASDHGMHCWDSFNGFLTCAFYSLRQATHKLIHGDMSDEIEEKVLKEQKRFKDWTKFAEAMGLLTLALEDAPCDFLGSFMSEMEMNDSKWKGQCFTPPSVTRLMAEMTCQNFEPDDDRTLMLNEPCVGGGAMVLAVSEILKKKGFFPWHYHWVATDIDWRCFAMSYIQLTLCGIPATVIHGNSLSLEVFDQAPTIVAVMHPPRNHKKNEKAIVAKPDPDRTKATPVQMTLF